MRGVDGLGPGHYDCSTRVAKFSTWRLLKTRFFLACYGTKWGVCKKRAGGWVDRCRVSRPGRGLYRRWAQLRQNCLNMLDLRFCNRELRPLEKFLRLFQDTMRRVCGPSNMLSRLGQDVNIVMLPQRDRLFGEKRGRNEQTKRVFTTAYCCCCSGRCSYVLCWHCCVAGVVANFLLTLLA